MGVSIQQNVGWAGATHPGPGRVAEASDPRATPARLAELAADGNLLVRKAAASHPGLPREMLERLRRAGSSADLAGFARPSVSVSAYELQKLAQLGEWGKRLAARHPNTSATLLVALAEDRLACVRLDVARHREAPVRALELLLTDDDPAVRAMALGNMGAPRWLVWLLMKAGSSGDLSRMVEPKAGLAANDLERLSGLGPWGRKLAARHPDTPDELRKRLARDALASVRGALAENPSAQSDELEALLTIDDRKVRLQLAQNRNASARIMRELAVDGDTAIRAAAAAHPQTPAAVLMRLACDGGYAVRAAAVGNHATPAEMLSELTAAGSSADLMTMTAHTAPLTREALRRLCNLGLWGRRLASRHPNTPDDMLEELAVDGDVFIRESVTRHPSRPAALIDRLVAAGSAPDMQGYGEPDPCVFPDELVALSHLGPWARRVAARHPNMPPQRLAQLAKDPDPDVRQAVAQHPATPDQPLSALARDPAAKVRWALVNRAALPGEAVRTLSRDPAAAVRCRIAQRPDTPADVLDQLRLDLDEDVRALAVAVSDGEAMTHREKVIRSAARR